MNRLEIKHLRMLCMIHQTGNMTRAAQNLYVTQSALSQQLKDIEAKLGTQLFFRTNTKMVLTRIGKNLLEKAKTILDEIQAAEADIDRSVNGETGNLKIGVRCLFCYMWLPRVLKQFQERYPNVDIDIRNASEPQADLICEKIDIAVSAADEIDPRIEFAPLFEDEVVVVMSEHDFHQAKPSMELTDFHGADIISLIEKSEHYFFDALLRNKSIKPRRYMTISHPEAMVDLIEAGLGMGILPQWFVSPYQKTKNLVTCPLTSRGKRLLWKATWLKSRQMPAYQKEFIRIMADHAINPR